MKKITPFLWFDTQAEEAMNHYVSIFKNSKVLSINRANGRVMTVTFELEGQEFMALNAGPQFKFTEAISFFVNCETQEEVDELWEKLSEGGQKGRCGWLKDKFGLSWQIIPTALGKLISNPDPEKSKTVFQAMMKMNKIEIEGLQRAYNQRTAQQPAPAIRPDRKSRAKKC
jgi:predicted 3-demethylubiquinone-9 3-methyltransferase (glyoxalase superfamily)